MTTSKATAPTITDLRIRFGSYIPHTCEVCGGAGEVPNPAYQAWCDRNDGEFDEIVKAPDSRDPFDVWAQRHPEDPVPVDIFRCPECEGRKVTHRQDPTAEDLLALLQLLETVVTDGLPDEDDDALALFRQHQAMKV